METECAWKYCENTVEQVPGTHRQRKYCSDSCRMEAYRDRHKAERTYKSSPFDQFGWVLGHRLKSLGIRDPEKRQELADAINREINERVERRVNQHIEEKEAAKELLKEFYGDGWKAAMENVKENCMCGPVCPYNEVNEVSTSIPPT